MSTAPATATPAEIVALTDMTRIYADASGDHPALANVRKETAARMDALCAELTSRGVDADALLEEIDAQLATYGQQ